MDKLACALKDVPQSIIKQIITNQMKNRVKEFLDEGSVSDKLDDIVEESILAYCKTNSKKIVGEYLEKHGQKMMQEAVDSFIDDNGIGDDSYSVVTNAVTDWLKTKLREKKGGKK